MTEGKFDEREIKKAVRKRYAEAVGHAPGSCCVPSPSLPIAGGCCGPAQAAGSTGRMAEMAGYRGEELAHLPADAVQNSFGCGNPLAFAGVRPGQTVLDIGSGAGIDCLLAAERVGPTGKVIGLDMTPEMIERARRNAAEAGAAQVEFRFGEAERMPVENDSIDWLISNCVINLSPDKPAVFREIARVLRPGGRISISDIVAEELPAALRESRDAWTGCLAGAIGEAEYVRGLEAAGLREVRVTSRIVYDASQLKGLFASSCCGIADGGGRETGQLAEAAAGQIWSARFEGLKPWPPATGRETVLDLAGDRDLAVIQALLAESGLPTDVEGHLGDFWVARHRGAVVGCVGMEVAGPAALFRSLAVAPAYRGAGLARQLFDLLAAQARARGVERAYLFTTTIVPLAERWGFRRIDRAELPPEIRATSQCTGGCCQNAAAMVRELRACYPPAASCT
jgi:arsenite methyltransferase